MSSNIKFCILGTDERSKYLRKLYKDEGVDLVTYEKADIVIGPTPFSKDNIKINGENIECDKLFNELKTKNKIFFAGAISQNLKLKLKNLNIRYVDLLEEENVAILNAIPTAEGAIATAIGMTNFSINGSNCLILGYGKIGKILAKMLGGLGANVFCEARKKEDLAFIKAMGYNSINLDVLDSYLNDMDVIFNTIPSMILDERRLQRLKTNCAVIDLASSPGGVDFVKAKELNINVVWSLALPSKFAPLTSAVYLKNTVDRFLRKG